MHLLRRIYEFQGPKTLRFWENDLGVNTVRIQGQ